MLRFFAFDARITRARLVAGLAIALVPAWIAVLLLRSGGALAMIAAGAIGGATVAKLLSESIRRRHDADAGGGAAVALLAGGTAAMSAASVVALGSGAFVLPPIVFAAVAIGWATMLLRPASAGPNRYAPPAGHPLVPAFGEGGPRRGGLLAAAALTMCGAALGYAAHAWLDGMRRQHDAIEHALATGPRPGDAAPPDALEQEYRKQNGR